MMLRHDPTFEGLLSAIAACLHDGVRPEALVPDLDQLTLLPCVDAPQVPGIRARFHSQLAQRLGAAKAEEVLTTAWQAYLSEDEGIGLAIYRFLEAALRRRNDPSGDLLDRDIARVVRMAQKTARLSHAFLGLIRFRTIGQSLFLADFSPECHILPLILPHFCERLPDQCFVIRDQRRGLAALHVPHRAPRIFVLAPPGDEDPLSDSSQHPIFDWLPTAGRQLALPATPPDATVSALVSAAVPAMDAPAALVSVAIPAMGTPAALEPVAGPAVDAFDLMWRRYLAALTIPERRNLKLQRANMPKKYWKYLAEQPGGS